ncbi:hypothetical protein BDW22DRAFT_1381142 [Trametopsis cervina]|nr:hypothetical protein BDW22DRAFT_1381142 [Trametopsis cervina]
MLRRGSPVNTPGESRIPDVSNSTGGKVKQTRRRHRLSCVECTKRRQKCDRRSPCGLCTARGIPHLCHWEPIVVRPTPQRPPTMARDATIETLMARIATLEAALVRQSTPSERGMPRLSSSPLAEAVHTPAEQQLPGSNFVDPTRTNNLQDRGEQEPRALIDYNVQVAAVALAQLSLAPRAEFVGNGTVLCAIHKLGDPDLWRFPYSTTSLTSPVAIRDGSADHRRIWEEPTNASSEYLSGVNTVPSESRTTPGRRLVAHLPPRDKFDELCDAFFAVRNWQYGLSEHWFKSSCQKMWQHLELRCDEACIIMDGCPACKEDVNPHWMSLLFSLLALSPTANNSTQERAIYFQLALEARRFMDDTLLSSPAYSTSEDAVNGGVLSCMATAFLAMYLAESGRVSEAWKLVGSGLRNAQALGMHRDPGWGKWQSMHKEERELRVLGWWWLVISDRLWSFVLGRPPMIPKGTHDVITEIDGQYADGARNYNALYLHALLNLSEIISDVAYTCFGPYTPPYAKVMELDGRFHDWELRLPDLLHWQRSHSLSPQMPQDDSFTQSTIWNRTFMYQRHMLAAWFYGGLMNLHRPYVMHSPPILPPPGSTLGSRHQLNPSRDRCIEMAITMTGVLCDFRDELETHSRTLEMVDAGAFTYFVFDGAVACAGALSQIPPHPKKNECLGLMDRAISVLARIADARAQGEGEIARRGIVVLKALKKAAGWDTSDDEKGEFVLLHDMIKKQHMNQTTYNANKRADTSAYSPESNTTSPFAVDREPTPSFDEPGGQRQTLSQTVQTPFIPYLSSDLHPGLILNSGPVATGHGSQLPFSHLPTLPTPMYPDTPYTNRVSPPSWNINASASRPLMQSMITPFQVLQGVDSDGSQGSSELDLDWIRLAGMDSWFSNQTS